MKQPLVKGGQGRSNESVYGDARALVWLFALAGLIFAIAMFVYRVTGVV